MTPPAGQHRRPDPPPELLLPPLQKVPTVVQPNERPPDRGFGVLL